jgi:predicted metal-dependent hydrolase
MKDQAFAGPLREMVQLPCGQTEVEWRRSKRARRVSLRIDPAGGTVIVTLPMRAGRRAGMALLIGQADWVAQHLAALPAPLAIINGAELPIEGQPHRICHCPAGRFAARLAEDRLEVCGDASFLPRRVTDFLRGEARRRLSARAVATAARAGLAPRRISVKDTRSRWGSCTSDRALSFSWRLLMAPAFVQDYVVAHEVAHLRHMNHGPEFWRLVAELTPHEQAAREWLQLHGPGLLRIG